MGFKLIVLIFLVKIVVARIKLDVKIEKDYEDQNVNISYTGKATRTLTEADMNSFKLGQENFDREFTAYVETLSSEVQSACQIPRSRYTSCEEFYNDFEGAMKVLSIKSASVKSLTKRPVVVGSQDFENSSNRTIKVKTGVTQNIENILTTSWSEQQKLIVYQDAKYEINFDIVSVGGKTDFSFTTTGGVSGEKTKTETLGTTNGLVVELKPGEAVRAVLLANAGYLEIEVVHKASLKGHVCHRHNELWLIIIEALMTSRGIENEVTTTETINFNFFVDAQVSVHKKKTGPNSSS